MTENRYNLIDEAWIPIAGMGLVSLRTLFSNKNIRMLSGTPQQKIALMKLLLAICQAAWTPKDEDEWFDISPEKLATGALAYLERWHDRFWLYGEQPFLQLPAVYGIKLESFGIVMTEVATGNTTVVTEYHQEKSLTDSQKALLLIEQISMALGGKKPDNELILTPGFKGKTNEKGKASTARPSPSIGFKGLLHSFALGKTLWETLLFNIFTQEEIEQIKIYREGVGHPPWEEMPAGEDCPVARRLRSSLMGRLVPMCRFILFSEQGMYLTEGIQHLNYSEGIYDPSITTRMAKEKKVMVRKAIWVDSDIRPWRELPALLGFLASDTDSNKTTCYQLKYALSRAKESGREFGVWAGGIQVSSNVGEQYVSGKDNVVESSLMLHRAMLNADWFNIFKLEILCLDKLSKILYGCVAGYFSEFKNNRGKDIAAVATRKFWVLCELQVQKLLTCCQEVYENKDSTSLEILHKTFYGYLMQLYNETCPAQDARQIAAWAQHCPISGDKLAAKSITDPQQQSQKVTNQNTEEGK